MELTREYSPQAQLAALDILEWYGEIAVKNGVDPDNLQELFAFSPVLAYCTPMLQEILLNGGAFDQEQMIEMLQKQLGSNYNQSIALHLVNEVLVPTEMCGFAEVLKEWGDKQLELNDQNIGWAISKRRYFVNIIRTKGLLHQNILATAQLMPTIVHKHCILCLLIEFSQIDAVTLLAHTVEMLEDEFKISKFRKAYAYVESNLNRLIAVGN